MLIYLLLFATAAFAQDAPTSVANAEEASICVSKDCTLSAGYLLRSMDQGANPCDDFYQFACGGWINSVRIPQSKTGYSRFTEIRNQVGMDIEKILNEDENSDNLAKIYYDKCMKPEKKSVLLLEFIKTFRQIISNFRKHHNREDQLAALLGLTAFWTGHRVLLSPDLLTDGTRYHLNFRQPELALGSPSKYTNTESNAELQAHYQAVLTNLASAATTELNVTLVPEEAAGAVYQFESQLSQYIQPGSKIRDPHFTYNLVSLGNLSVTFPFVNWRLWLKQLLPSEEFEKLDDSTLVNIQSPPFLKDLKDLVTSSPPDLVYLYILSQVALRSLENFNVHVDKADGFFLARKGVTKPPPLAEHCIEKTVTDLDKHIVGKLYVDKFFSLEDRMAPEKMTKFVQDEMLNVLRAADWIDKNTLAAAETKLNKMVINTGFPDFYNDPKKFADWHRQLSFSRNDSAFEVARRVFVWRNKVNYYNKIFKDVDQKNDWFIGPRWVTAYNSLESNAILFPAGILRRPFFHPRQPPAINFGAMGSVIGHEITHGFDDLGKTYDELGNLREWISPETRAKFEERKQCFKDQYSKFRVKSLPNEVPSVNISIGEDIADVGGVKIAYHAFQKYLSENPAAKQRLPGLLNSTQEQLFFLGWANFHCAKFRPSALPGRLHRVHSYNEFRVRGPLANFLEFAKAYKCPLGSKMNPEKKCKLW